MAIPKTSGGEMPFLDHLEELRWRIIYSLIGLVIGIAVGAYFSFGYDVLEPLQAPLLPYLDPGQRLTVLSPMDGFTIRLQVAFVIGLTVAAPIIGYQVWAFLSPALHKPEKRVALPFLVAAALLFVGGVALAWFFVMPITLEFFHKLNGDTLQAQYTATAYFGFATNLALAFGLAFELPLALVALSALGILSAATLNKSRRFAVILIFIASALISPGDAITATLAMAVPLYLLYEVAIVCAYAIERRRRRTKERAEAESGTPE
jgi:sec-independent protein translocase protein TatC